MSDLAVQRGITLPGQWLVSEVHPYRVGGEVGGHQFGNSFAAGYIHTLTKQVKIRAELLPL